MARSVVAIVYDRLCVFEFGVAVEIFGIPRPELDVEWYDFRTVATTSEPISTFGGATLSATTDLTLVEHADTVVIPGWPDPAIEVPPEVCSALVEARRRGARLVSLCAGVFVLARAGVLDGLQATTHWRLCGELAERHPDVEVLPDVLYTDNGQVLTSAGSAAALDLGLHIVRLDHGAAVAAQVARRLVMLPQREGDQAQYVPVPRPGSEMATDANPISEAMAWAMHRLGEDITVASFASSVFMSERNFARRFVEQVGTTPHAWILQQRIDRARALLETTDLSIGEIARQSGLRTPETLRHHFRRVLRTSPLRYRASFTQP